MSSRVIQLDKVILTQSLDDVLKTDYLIHFKDKNSKRFYAFFTKILKFHKNIITALLKCYQDFFQKDAQNIKYWQYCYIINMSMREEKLLEENG